MEDDWLNSVVRLVRCVSPEWVYDTYREFYRPSYFIRKRDLSRQTHHHIHIDTFTKWSGDQACFLYHIFEVSFETNFFLRKTSSILLFASFLS